MGGAFAIIFAGLMSLLAGSYMLLGEGLTGLVFIILGWVLIIFGIRKVVTFNKASDLASNREGGDAR